MTKNTSSTLPSMREKAPVQWRVSTGLTPYPEALDFMQTQLVRPRRLELPPVLPDSDLNAARLPIPPRPHIKERAV